jgi:hypothetical protein
MRVRLPVGVVVGVAAAAVLLLGPGRRAQAQPPETYDDLTTLLARYVDEHGFVDYRTWKAKDEPALRAVVRRLSAMSVTDLPQAEVKAYWINVYNAVTLEAMLEFYPLRSIRDKAADGGGYNVWNDYPFTQGGRRWSLNQIEHEVLRPMGDPRVHAAVNCASLGCPPLRREAYVAARLDEQLDDQVRTWLNDPTRGARVGDGVVALSEIFSWFGDDFAPDVPGRLRWVSRWLRDPAMREAVARRQNRVESIPWDWRLNQQGAAAH